MPAREDCVLRPMEERDLDLVRRWRNAEHIRRVSYTDHVIGPDEHRAWFARVARADDAAPFVFECEGRPVGVVNLTEVDRAEGSCSWGFYIGAEDAPRGAGGAMGFCALEHVFETGLRIIRGEALARNEASIRFHLRLGFAREDGPAGDVLAFVLSAESWTENREMLFEKTFGGSGTEAPPTTL